MHKAENPTGTVISYMGNNVPEGYLSCNESVHNIEDYPELAEQINKEFGKYNYFGGNGTTTFAVPDLRGEFLRGTGRATRNTGSGSNVGIHQDATSIPHLFTRLTVDGYLWIWAHRSKLSKDNDVYPTNYDTVKNETSNIYESIIRSDNNSNGASWGLTTGISSYTTRPTNTSVLYCIKY